MKHHGATSVLKPAACVSHATQHLSECPSCNLRLNDCSDPKALRNFSEHLSGCTCQPSEVGRLDMVLLHGPRFQKLTEGDMRKLIRGARSSLPY